MAVLLRSGPPKNAAQKARGQCAPQREIISATARVTAVLCIARVGPYVRSLFMRTPMRRHLFELNDSPWAPVALRETIIESLSRTLAWGRILEGLVAPFREFVERARASEVLDLCSGAGGPAAILADEIARAGGRAPRFIMTDLQPHPQVWARLRDAHPGTIDFVAEPIDATRIPRAVGEGRARVIINALHHFRPELAGAILRGACDAAPGVFVAEGFERDPLLFSAFAAAGVPALFANPVLSPRHKLAKALFTWATPIALAASVWDGLVSTLRVYTKEELLEMVAPLGDAFEWTYGTYAFGWGGRAYYFYGTRRSRPR
jgi:hypothetical protein